ncbi:recombinase family protein [Vibrio nigripulchritudo]|uniref:recombinase family protein n=1 Tax=Vibrio nigripulchritudo TaxID=28173 RepID=UPI00066AC618
MRVWAYLRASTDEQDATRAKDVLEQFSNNQGYPVSHWFIENESGAKLDRPELFRLLNIASPGDVILVEQVDRISRLNKEDWEKLKSLINEKGLKLVALDLPFSFQFMQSSDSFTDRMLAALNTMMLDTLAAVARKDYDTRRERQLQGVQKAKSKGLYKGRPRDQAKREAIMELLQDGKTYSRIQCIVGCSRHTIASVSKELKALSQ